MGKFKKRSYKAIQGGCDITEGLLEAMGDLVFGAFEQVCGNCKVKPKKKGKKLICPKCGRRIR